MQLSNKIPGSLESAPWNESELRTAWKLAVHRIFRDHLRQQVTVVGMEDTNPNEVSTAVAVSLL
jgi:hypothetical protein